MSLKQHTTYPLTADRLACLVGELVTVEGCGGDLYRVEGIGQDGTVTVLDHDDYGDPLPNAKPWNIHSSRLRLA